MSRPKKIDDDAQDIKTFMLSISFGNLSKFGPSRSSIDPFREHIIQLSYLGIFRLHSHLSHIIR